MSYKNGRLYICDLCKTTHFCEETKYIREPLPESWQAPNDLEEIKDLCPDCSKKYQAILKEFKSKWQKEECLQKQ